MRLNILSKAFLFKITQSVLAGGMWFSGVFKLVLTGFVPHFSGPLDRELFQAWLVSELDTNIRQVTIGVMCGFSLLVAGFYSFANASIGLLVGDLFFSTFDFFCQEHLDMPRKYWKMKSFDQYCY